jgi:hypothetical protein
VGFRGDGNNPSGELLNKHTPSLCDPRSRSFPLSRSSSLALGDCGFV